MAYSECKTQSHVDVNQCNGVAYVTLNRPDKRNAISRMMLLVLADFLRSTIDDQTIRVLVLRGSNHFFSAGADLEWMQQGKSQTIHENINDAKLFFDTFQLLNNYPKPVVVFVENGAYGGALGLVACADIAVATNDANFSFSEVRLGLVPATIAPFVVAKIGHAAARRYMLSAETFSTHVAVGLGLVHFVCDALNADETLENVVANLLQNGPEAMATTKQLLNKLVDSSSAAQMGDYVAQLIASARASGEGQEGVAAFFEKRNAYWKQ
jgi:methylglutaconyl-CoA hydratase